MPHDEQKISRTHWNLLVWTRYVLGFDDQATQEIKQNVLDRYVLVTVVASVLCPADVMMIDKIINQLPSFHIS